MSDFLPEGYEIPSSTDKYMRLVKGENRFRILSSPILGYEYWIEKDDKRIPLRTPMNKPFSVDVAENPEDIKHFWAMVVWNYAAKRVQILEITQKGVQKVLRALAKDDDWGSPVQKYDIVITRSGDGMETRYEVLPKPATTMDEGIIAMFEGMNVRLEALYESKDPFAGEVEEVDVEEVDKGIEAARKVRANLK